MEFGISFIVVVRNAESHVASLLSNYLEQDYPKKNRELIIVDGCSSDRTLGIVEEMLPDPTKIDYRIFSNPAKTLSSGWNLALSKARYSVVLRVDAHATFGPEFISRNMALINEGYMVVGGRRETLPSNGEGDLLFIAETSRFGAGSSGFRNPGPRRFVDTIGHGAYRTEVYKKVGGYDERLSRNQDIEIHIRMKKAGIKFLFDPSIWSSHTARPSLAAFLKQKFLNGFWGAIILSLVEKYPFYRHFAPLVFVLGVLFSSICFLAFGLVIPLALVLGTYFFMAVVVSVIDGKKSSKAHFIFLPAVFFAMHLSYGIGSLVGLIYIPVFHIRHQNYHPKFPFE